MNALVITSLRSKSLPALPAADIDRATTFARQDKAAATRTAYRSDFASFQAFCRSRGSPRSRPRLRRWRPIWQRRLKPA
jgi:hypothetical protein